MNFKPEVLVNQKNKELRWVGKLGIKGIFDGEHFFLFEQVGQSQVKFTQGEHFNGLLSGVFMLLIRKDTEAGFKK